MHSLRPNAVGKTTAAHSTTSRRRSDGQCERGKFCVGRSRAARSALVSRCQCHEVAGKIAWRMPSEPSAREHIRPARCSSRCRRLQAQAAGIQGPLRAIRRTNREAREGVGEESQKEMAALSRCKRRSTVGPSCTTHASFGRLLTPGPSPLLFPRHLNLDSVLSPHFFPVVHLSA